MTIYAHPNHIEVYIQVPSLHKISWLQASLTPLHSVHRIGFSWLFSWITLQKVKWNMIYKCNVRQSRLLNTHIISVLLCIYSRCSERSEVLNFWFTKPEVANRWRYSRTADLAVPRNASARRSVRVGAGQILATFFLREWEFELSVSLSFHIYLRQISHDHQRSPQSPLIRDVRDICFGVG
jgi:hypothetical protein